MKDDTDLLLLNIGNTHTQIAVLGGDGVPGALQRVLTADVIDGDRMRQVLSEYAGMSCLAACVVPVARLNLEKSGFFTDLRFLTAGLVTELDFSRIDSSTLGADRIANAVAALEMVSPPVMILDCGTAITSEVVDASYCFRGGIIAPGRRLQRQALADYTGQLPNVPLQDSLPGCIGTTTREAITAGVDLGVLGLAQRVVDDTRQQFPGQELTVLVTGGDAPYFLKNIPGLMATPEDFTLRGLVKIGTRL